jgi:hypothetical protein
LYGEDAVDLPLEGWEEAPKVPWETGGSDFMRYENVVRNRTKAVLVMGGHSVDGGSGYWRIVGYRACPPGEYDQLRGRTTDDAPWLDATGRPTTVVRTAVGPAHCGWQSTILLYTDHDATIYIRDPLGVLRPAEVGEYLPDTALPDDAVDSGFGALDRQLYTSPDRNFVFIRTPTGVERWPRTTGPIGCA